MAKKIQRNSDAGNNSVEPAEPKKDSNFLQKLWAYRRYLVIEPFFFFYLMASVFNSVAMQNFPLDKACRVNLGFSKIICDTTLDKSIYGIDCDDYTSDNSTMGPIPGADLTIGSADFNTSVCKAELEAQLLTSDVSSKRAPIAAIFPLIVLLFAGGWADRYNKRKPCMILPIVGEALSFTCLLISAIFFETLPMEFGSYLEAIVPALFGGITFCLMAIYSYITIATPEEDRIFRFGIFAMFVTAVPFIGQPVSGWLFLKLGYILSFAMAVCFQIVAISYIIFFVKEVRPPPKNIPPPLPDSEPPIALQGADNKAYDDLHKRRTMEITESNVVTATAADLPVSRSFFREFFDPTLVMDCVRLLYIRRPNNGRMLLILLILAYFLTLGPAAGENDYWYRYTLKKLNWNGNTFSIYITFSSAFALIGTFIGTAILSKLLKVSDPVIGILSAMAIVISRILFAFSNDTKSFYVAGLVDMFVSLRVIAIKTIGSSIVDGEELTKMYSIFGISEPIGQFIFTPIFSHIYINTVETFPGAIFLFGEIFYVPNVIVFVLCYFILKRNKNNAKKTDTEIEGAPVPELSTHPQQLNPKSGAYNAAYTNAECEITSL